MRDLDSDATFEIRADFLVGATAPGPPVRKAIGATLQGTPVIQRVQSTYIRAPELLGMMGRRHG